MSFYDIPKDEQRYARRAKPPERQRLTNEQFAALPPAEQRVAIARDVLEWISMGKAVPHKGTYLRVFEPSTLPADFNDAATKEWLPPELEAGDLQVVNGHSCTVCGLGSVFAVAAERGCFPLREGASGGASMHRALKPYFDSATLLLIECAFERSVGFDYEAPVSHQAKQAARWFGATVARAVEGYYTSYFSPEVAREVDRRVLRAIMQDIIDNGGAFVPPPVPV
jgi:hypothetical protein